MNEEFPVDDQVFEELLLASVDPDVWEKAAPETQAKVKARFAEMDQRPELMFFHGKESGPHGSKFKALEQTFLTVESPDFQGLDLEERIAKADAVTAGRSNLLLIGFSLGGLVAALLYSRHPERCCGYLLLAPALHWQEAGQIERVPEHARIIHGLQDDIVPIASVEAFCEKFKLPLTRVVDDHSLHRSYDSMLDAVSQLRVFEASPKPAAGPK